MTSGKRGLVPQQAVFVFVCFIPLACSNSDSRVYPVRGVVFFKGQPASGAAVHFHPLDKEEGTTAYAEVKEDGSFELSTYATNDGAEAGDYVVTITWREVTQGEEETIFGPDRLGDRYSKPDKSTLKATVVAGENEVPRFDLNE